MINFTVGPVQSNKTVLAMGAEQVPYFRTNEFSDLMFENENLMLKFSNAPEGSRVAFITGSGTAAMESAIMNTLDGNDKVLVINGGSFGDRFVKLLRLHEIPYTEIKLATGKQLTKEILSVYNGEEYSAFVVNVNETSTGVYYDINMISDFCKRNNMFLIVDAISSFLADQFNMMELGVDVMLTGSQKALACPPGISIIVLSPSALKRIENVKTKCMYLDLKDALKNMERGQTPFTPAVGILRQIHVRLLEISDNGGVSSETHKIGELATYFRDRIKELPFKIVSESMSNAVTPLHPTTASAYDIFTVLKDEYDIWVCPNGGNLKDTVFRVGHIGYLTKADYDTLLNAFEDMQKRVII
jgi:aspartate aminotransferase-like enzyme